MAAEAEKKFTLQSSDGPEFVVEEAVAAAPTEAEAEAEKKFTLQSSDDAEFVVEEAVAVQSETIKNMFEEGCDGVIPLSNVHSKILALVIEYCTHHARTKAANADKYCKDTDADKEFDKKFVDVDQDILFDLILAANYLDIKDLLDLTCETVASMIRGKKPEEIRKTFHIKNDWTKEEEEEIRKDYQWAFE